MRNLWQEENGVYTVMAGATITNTIVEAIELSVSENNSIKFEFNGVTVSVQSDSEPELIYRDWSRALNGYIEQNVGPYPSSILTDEEKANDAHIERENEHKRQERQAEYEAQVNAKREYVEAKLAGIPHMEESNPEMWEKTIIANQDPYGSQVVTYAERWARLMQLEMAGGKTLEEVADVTSHEADLEGITGFMYGAAVSTLAQCWKHGEQLRRWHNLDSQFGTEGEVANQNGGVLNPALVTFSRND